MRRAVARGRMFPQSFSTDRRYGRLSLKAIGLFPLMWANADDQGRLCGDFEEIKYAVCPNIDHITKQDIPELLQELQKNKLILSYDTPKSAAIQLLDWWEVNQKMQWAWPSDYPPPNGWKDHLRYKKSAQEVATINWPPPDKSSGEPSGESSGESSGEPSGEKKNRPPLTTPLLKGTKTITKRVRGRGRGNSPEVSGEKSSVPSQTDLEENGEGGEERVYEMLSENYRKRWGHVKASDPDTIIPRLLKAKDKEQLRGLAKEMFAAGGCEEPMITKAFNEAANAEKQHISYVRAILLDWLGAPRRLGHGT